MDLLVSLINEKHAADKSMRTYNTDDAELGDWLAAALSGLGFRVQGLA